MTSKLQLSFPHRHSPRAKSQLRTTWLLPLAAHHWLLSWLSFLGSLFPIILSTSPVTITDWHPNHTYNINEGFESFLEPISPLVFIPWGFNIHSYAPLRTLGPEVNFTWISHPCDISSRWESHLGLEYIEVFCYLSLQVPLINYIYMCIPNTHDHAITQKALMNIILY